jgi:hypothetical protein
MLIYHYSFVSENVTCKVLPSRGPRLQEVEDGPNCECGVQDHATPEEILSF